MADCLNLLASSEYADLDRSHFALAQLAFWLLAAPDGHAKNFSIYHRAGGNFGMTPIYDVLSAWPVIGDGPNQFSYQRVKLAMAVRSKNAHYRLSEIQTRHWLHLANTCGVPGLWNEMLAMVQTVNGVLDRVAAQLPDTFPPSIWTPIADGMRRHAAAFLRGLTGISAQGR
jgi:serine/threonine-protein kinase HipA